MRNYKKGKGENVHRIEFKGRRAALTSRWSLEMKSSFEVGSNEVKARRMPGSKTAKSSRLTAWSRWWRRGSGCARAMLSEEEVLLMPLMEAG